MHVETSIWGAASSESSSENGLSYYVNIPGCWKRDSAG